MRHIGLVAVLVAVLTAPVGFAQEPAAASAKQPEPAAASAKQPEPAAAPAKQPEPAAAPAVVKSTVVADEDIAIPSGSIQTRAFEAPKGGTLELDVKGVKSTDKGYDVAVMTLVQLENLRAKRSMDEAPAFQASKVSGAKRSVELAPGSYVVVVSNAYNTFKGMIVHVQATFTPAH